MPFPDQLDDLSQVLTSEERVEPAMPARFVTAAVDHRVIGACVLALEDERLALPDEEARRLRDAYAVAALSTGLAPGDTVLDVDGPAAERTPHVNGVAVNDRESPAVLDLLFVSDPAERSLRLLERRAIDQEVEVAERPECGIGVETVADRGALENDRRGRC